MLNRRSLLQGSALLSLSPVVPGLFLDSAAAADTSTDQPLLVVIELSGGNDGLNTVIPLADENYAKYRDKLRIDAKDVIRLNDSLGLHPAMQAAGELYDSGRLAIVPGVGYPNPNRSHFRSMAIWHSARLGPEEHNGIGWLGRSIDVNRRADLTDPDAVFVGEGTVPSAIVGRRANSVAIGDGFDLQIPAGLSTAANPEPDDDLHAFVHRAVNSSYAAAQQFAEATTRQASDSRGYPDYRLAQQLRSVARMIRMGIRTRIFYVSQPGYDTHSGQKFQHERLLRQYSRSLLAFLDDMKQSGVADRVVVLTFSEFGRRVQENASAGTDHGTSGPVFVAGEPVHAGVLSRYPSLADLDDGDLETTIDFRQVYASLLTDWLNVEATGPLGGNFQSFPVVES